MKSSHTGIARKPKPAYGKGIRRFTGLAVGLLGVTALSGCQLGPGLPFGFGPPLDNLVGIFVVLAIIGILYAAFGRSIRARWNGNSPGTPESIARERYARGEITQDQYFEILRTLGHRP